MNKVYKVVWNASLGTWVAVSEIAKGKTKNSVSIGQTVLVDNSYTAQLDKEFSYKKLLLAIFTVFTANFAHSGYEAGTASTSSNCTQTSIGSGGEATGAIAIGSDNSTASGNACASQINSVAIGKSSWATGFSALAIGPDTKARANYSIAMGNSAQALSQGSMAFGSGAYANSNSTADGTGAVAFGNDAVALGKNSFALGTASTVTDDNTVSFGYTKGDIAYFDGTPRTGTDLSKGYQNGKWINDRFMRLANVANGYKQENDAVNVSQIRPLAQALGTNVSAIDGTVSAPNYIITKTDSTTYAAVQTVPAALKNLNDEVVKPLGFVGDSGTKATRKLGQDLNIKGGATSLSTNSNIGVISNGSDSLTLRLAKNVDLGTDGSVTTGNTVINNAGITTDKVTVGSVVIDKTTNKISGVADGTASDDAVNKGQLDAVSAQQTAADNASVKYDNATTKDKVTLGGVGSSTAVTLTNVKAGALSASSTDAVNGSQLDATNQAVTSNSNAISTLNTTVGSQGTQISSNTNNISNLQNQTFKLQANGDSASSVKSSDTVQFLDGDNIAISRTGNNITVATKKDVNFDKVTVGSVVIDKTTNKISGVADGTASDDAVNKGQLDAVSAQQTAADNASVKYDNATTKDKVTLGGVGSSTAVTLTNVKAGALSASSTDAVNGSQLDATNQAVTSNSNAISTLNTTVGSQGTQISSNTNNISNLQNQTFKLQANGDSASSVKSSDTVQFLDGDNIAISRTGNNITVATKKDVNFDKVTVGSVVIDKTTNKISGVADGTASDDAVNKGQLDAVSAQQTAADNASVKYDNATTKDKVTLGGVGSSTAVTLTNVKAGALSASSTDAVNGSQLDATNQAVTSNSNAISTLNTTVGSQGTQISSNTNNISNLQNQTFKLQANGDSASSVKSSDTVQFLDGDNIAISRTGNNITVATKKDVNFDKVTVGSVVIDKTTNKISGVADGTASDDAVNKGQLDAVSAQQTAADNASVKYDNATTKDKVTLGGVGSSTAVTLTNVKAGALSASSTDAVNGSQLDATNQAVTSNSNAISTLNTTVGSQGTQISSNTNNISNLQNQTFKLQANGDSASSVKSSDTVQFLDGDNIAISRTGNNITVATKKDVNFDKVTVGSVVIDKTTNKISGVADGTASDDAVNKGQLDAVSAQQTAADNASVKYDNATTKDKVTLGGVGSSTAVTLTNVKAGALSASSTDAVNGSQLDATNQAVTSNSNAISTLNTTVGSQGTQISSNTNNISNLQNQTFKLQANGDSASSVKSSDTVQFLDGDNIAISRTGNNITVATKKDVNFDKVTVGSVVIDKTTNKISGVADGTASDDAVNKGQLDAVSAQQTAADNASVKYDNATTKDKVTLGGVGSSTAVTLTNVKAGALSASSTDAVNGSQLDATNQAVTSNSNAISTLNTTVGSQGTQISSNTNNISNLQNQTFKLQANGDSASSVKSSDTVQFLDGDNIAISRTGNNITVATKKDVNFDKVTVGSVVIDKTTNKISGVADGTASDDAVNKGQLDAVSAQQTAADNASVKYDNATTKDKVTLGGVGSSTAVTLTNVKAGALSASSTDAVNGSQLDATNQAVTSNSNAISTLNTTVGSQGTQISSNTNNISNLQNQTFKLQANGDSASSVKSSDTVQFLDGDNIAISRTGNNITVATKKDVNFDKVTVGSVVIDKTTNKISGVADGTASDDAVNKGQLDAVSAQQTAADNASVKYDNATTKDKVTLGGVGSSTAVTLTNVKAGALSASSTDAVNGSQLDATNQAVTSNSNAISTLNTTVGSQGTQISSNTNNISNLQNQTFKLQANGDSASSVKSSDTVQFLDGDNIAISRTGNNITVATKKDVNFDKVTVGSVVIDKTTNKISGVADGTASDDAVNKGQLDAVSAQQTAADNASVKYDNATTKDKVTLGGVGSSTAVTLTNVKAGALSASSTDAVNGSQLDATNQAVTSNSNAISTLNTTVGSQGTQISSNTNNISNLQNQTFKLQANGDSASSVKSSDTVQFLDGDNIAISRTGNNITVATKKDVNFDKVTVGSVVIDKTTNKISGVADGTASDDAVNKGQLDTLAAQQAATDSAAVKYDNAATKDKVTLGGATSSSSKDLAGKITTTGGTSLSNVASAGDITAIANASKAVNAGDLNNAVIDVSTSLTNKGFHFGDGNTNNQYKLGETINVKGSTDGSIISTTTADGVQLGLGNTVKVGSGATQITVDGSTGKIGGLSNKTWNAASITSGQAATEDQLKLVSDAQTATDSAAVKYDSVATKDKVTLGGGGAGTTITNVKAGGVNASSSDAINGSQLYTVSNSIKNAIGGSTTINAVTGAITTTNIGGTGANTIDGAINSVSNTAKAAKTEVKEGNNIKVTSVVGADGQSVYTVATAQDVSFDKVTVGGVVLNQANSDITGLSNKDLKAADFATKGRAATEEQLKQVISSNITEVVDASGNKVNIIDQVVNTKLDNTNQDSLFLTYNKQGQETTDRLTIGQTVQKMNTEGTKFFHTNAATSKGGLGTTNDSSASGLNSTAIGVNAIVAAGADSSVALGHNAKVQGIQSIAIGNGAEALGTQSISIGTGNKVKGNHSGAIGDPTIVNGSNSYSVGNNNQVLTDDTFVLGNNVTKTVAGSVVLGTDSAATTGAGVTGYALSTATNADKTTINKTTSTTGAVAVGDAASGIYRQITGVAAGTQDADAVNVAQLKAVGNQVVTTQNSLVNSLGGNATVNANGTITGPTYNVAKSTQTNVGDALDALDKAIQSTAVTSKTTVTKGQNIVVNKSKNVDGSDNYEIATAKDLTVDSVKAGNTIFNNAGITIGNNTVVLNNTGLIIAGGPSVTTQGINAGNKQITNVAAGTDTTDAVNKGQLDSAINSVASDVTQLSNNAVKYDTASKDKITLGGSNGTTITNLKDGAVVQGSKDAVNGGQLWTVQQQVNQNTNDIQGIQTNISNINNGKSGLVQQQTQGGDITVGKDVGGTTLNVSGTQGDRVVTGVKDGAINATSKDAVNGSQLNVTNNKVVELLGGGAGYNNITNSFTNPTYKVDGKDYNNVGGAVDALNKADQALGNRITNLGDRLEQAFTETNQRIDGIEKKANAGIAAAMALEAAPFVAGKFTYAAGASYHGGENAIGVTLRKTADNGRWSITGGVAAASQGDPSVRIGISGVID